ncbi:MAG TPA: cell division protein FtsQ/DivIB [Burkholderiaceae bacterium]|jgi:cell division protein FtsQ|nr:cell division protein FtsQ/DivIB [Burkholderiaceae bacterium]
MHQANLPLPADVRAMNALVALAVLALVLMGLALAWQWALRNPAFDLTRITVRGDTAHVNAATLRANVAPRLAGNFFTMDLSKTRAAFEAVPWVRRASVQRLFPNALAVSLQEHKPVAFWGDDDDSTMLNEQAEVFVANVDEIDEDLPHLTGPTGQAPLVLAMYRALAPELDVIEAPLAMLELSPRGGWRATTEADAVIELGQGSVSEVQARLKRFTRSFTQVASRYGRGAGHLESADLRHSEGYALRLRGVGELPPEQARFAAPKR